jgi:hypothetical protein
MVTSPFRPVALIILLLLAVLSVTETSFGQTPPEGISGQFAETVVRSSGGVTGSMSYSIAFDLPAARGDVQPDLTLTYGSDRGTGEAGEGWRLNNTSIERAPLSGWPKYSDLGTPESEDRYEYGGRPLTFICTVGASGVDQTQCPASPAIGAMPAWAKGYRHYRLQVEGSFERFFLSPARDRWIVQKRGGATLEFGAPLTQPALASGSHDDDEKTGKTFRWNLVRVHDRHLKRNLIVYRWTTLQGRSYLGDIFYTPPALLPSAGVNEFAYHIQLSWEKPAYRRDTYAQADRRHHIMRLRRVAIASKSWAGTGPREFVRAYNLSYFANRDVPGTASQAPVWNRSHVRQIQMEGRCAVMEVNGQIPNNTNCATLPPTTFDYQRAEIVTGATAIRSTLSHTLPYVNTSGIYDVNRDGLPDIVQAWPQNFDDPGSVTSSYNECPGASLDGAIRNWYWVQSLHSPTITNPNPHESYLGCKYVEDDNPAYLRSARELTAYVNRMGSPGGAVTLQHHCLDAGNGGDGTLTKWQVMVPPGSPSGTPIGSPTALFSQWGAEAAGQWGNALFLWSKAGWRGFDIEPANADEEFCPQVRGPNPPLSYPSLRLKETDTNLWAKGRPTPAPAPVGGVMTDIDGDGMLDRIGQAAATAPYFRQGTVGLTRRISKLENTDGIHGPALVPFAFSPDANSSVIPETQMRLYVDMNGDGLVDLVTWNADDAIHVRPGNGRGHFGCSPTVDQTCTVVGNGSWLGSAYRMSISGLHLPFPLWTRGEPSLLVERESHFQDVTGDGLADLIQFHPSDGPQDPGAANPHGRIRLWINVDGHTLRCASTATDCVVATITDLDQPLGSPLGYRVNFLDFDANGTTDILVVGNNATWHHSFVKRLPGVATTRPGLLTRIRNGVGADVEVEYQTIQQLDRAANSQDALSFSRPWTSHVPVVVPVVTRMRIRDTSQVTGTGLAEPFQISREVRFAYRNPAYDLWDRSFKGFSRVRRILPGNEVTQTWYWFGPCEGGTVSIRCPDGSDEAPDEGWTGIPVRVDRFVEGAGPERPEH